MHAHKSISSHGENSRRKVFISVRVRVMVKGFLSLVVSTVHTRVCMMTLLNLTLTLTLTLVTTKRHCVI